MIFQHISTTFGRQGLVNAQANDLPLTMGEFLGAANFIIVTWWGQMNSESEKVRARLCPASKKSTQDGNWIQHRQD